MRTIGVCVLLLSLGAAACWTGPEVGPFLDPEAPPTGGEGDDPGDGTSDGGDEEPPAGQKGFSQLQAEIFTPTCANSYCHKGSPPPQAPMSLEGPAAYASLVGRPSTQVPGLMRVAPSEPSKSYLLLKLKNLAGTVGGTATRMPLNKPALSAEQLAQIEAWIARGAPND